MLSDLSPEKIYLCREPVDFRKSINGLSLLVEELLLENPLSGHWFVFTNRQRNKVKLLYWSRNGFCLWYKRLEKQRFKWPTHLSGQPVRLSSDQLRWLLDGYDLSKLKPHKTLTYTSVS